MDATQKKHYRPYRAFFNAGKAYIAQEDDRGFHSQPPSWQSSEFNDDLEAARGEARRRNNLMAAGRNPFTGELED